MAGKMVAVQIVVLPTVVRPVAAGKFPQQKKTFPEFKFEMQLLKCDIFLVARQII